MNIDEGNGILTCTAATPEGRLMLAVIESCFVHTGQKLRIISRHIAKGKVKTWDKLKSGGDTYGITVQKLREEKAWIKSEEFHPVTLRYAAEFIAEDPEVFVVSIRRRYAEILTLGWYEPNHYGITSLNSIPKVIAKKFRWNPHESYPNPEPWTAGTLNRSARSA